MMDAAAAEQPSGREAIKQEEDDVEMAHSLGRLRVTTPKVVFGGRGEENPGETVSLLDRNGNGSTLTGSMTTGAAWLSHLENGNAGHLDHTDSSEWQVVTTLDGVCCGVRKHRMIEVVHLRHANYGLRWGETTAKKYHSDTTHDHSKDARTTENDAKSLPAAKTTPFCVVGPHWWLMTATFTVFLVAALVVTVLTMPQAGLGEAVTGVLLSAACLSMYAKVGCTNPGIVERLHEPLDESYTYCDQCESYRPQGALHCMDCRVCIEEYDHHCPWTGKCIGKKNVKYFYAWLFFLVLAFVYEMIEFTTYMLPPQDQRNAFDSSDDDDDSFYFTQQQQLQQ